MSVPSAGPDPRARRWLGAALGLQVAGAATLVAVQVITDTWLPPPISFSQYGVGGTGWIFTLMLFLMAAASGAIARAAWLAGMVRSLGAVLPWGLWILGLIVMGLVPTNEYPEPLGLNGQVHQAAAIIGLIAGPIGALLLVGVRPPTGRGRVARRTVLGCGLLSYVFLILLVATNFDIDITGLGPDRAWAVHQSVAVCLDIVLGFALCAVIEQRSTRADHVPAPSVPESAR